MPLRLFASKPSTPNKLELSAPLNMEKAEADDKGLPTFSIMANSGVPMQARGFFDPVIIDLTGAKFARKVIPVIFNHDDEARAGHTTLHDVSNKGIKISGVVSATGDRAERFVKDSRNGFPFQASVGADIIKVKPIEAGEEIEVNGKLYQGPLIVAKKTSIYEVSIVTFGADGNTSASVSASLDRSLIMDFDSWLDELCATLELEKDNLTKVQLANFRKQFDKIQASGKESKSKPQSPQPPPTNTLPPPPTPEEQVNLRLAANTERIDKINATATRFSLDIDDEDFRKGIQEAKIKAIKEGISADTFELELHRKERPNPGKFRGVHTVNLEVEKEACEVALLRSIGMPMEAKNPRTGVEYGIKQWYSTKALEASHGRQYQGISLHYLMDLTIRAAGDYYHGNRKASEFLEATVQASQKLKASGFSTLNIQYILENVAQKQLISSFQAQEVIWPFITASRTLNDFKPHYRYRLDAKGSFRKVAQDGELKHISATDERFSLEADTFGAMLTLDRKTIRNDDLGAFVERSGWLGAMGANRIEESVFVLLLSNPGSFFASGNNNLISGAGSVLGLTALETARLSVRNQVRNGKPVLVSPSILLTGTALETTAAQLHANEQMGIGGGNTATGLVFTNNPNKGLYRPYISPYLNNTAITDQDGNAISGQSVTQWYLFTPPTVLAAIAIGFLDGRKTPYIETAETQFDIPGGLQIRAYFDWGVGMEDTAGAMKSAGA